ETATHIGIREAEDWFRPIDLAKECDIYISSRSGSHKEILLLMPWQWKREERNRFEQTSRTLQRKGPRYRCLSTKDQLVEKDVLMPVHNFSCGTFRMSKRCLHMMEELSSLAEKL
ncbi:hypothetical protein TNCV_2221411, partial [Trichonephila clavipes]